MKLHWGHYISIFIIIFLITGLILVFNIILDKKLNHQLVNEKYYEQELDFQKKRKEILRGDSISNKIVITQINKLDVKITFNDSLNIKSGIVSFYCPFEKNNDFKKTLSLNNNIQIINSEKFSKGIWEVEITFFNIENIEFIVRKKISMQ